MIKKHNHSVHADSWKCETEDCKNIISEVSNAISKRFCNDCLADHKRLRAIAIYHRNKHKTPFYLNQKIPVLERKVLNLKIKMAIYKGRRDRLFRKYQTNDLIWRAIRAQSEAAIAEKQNVIYKIKHYNPPKNYNIKAMKVVARY